MTSMLAHALISRSPVTDNYIYAMQHIDMRKIIHRMSLAIDFPTMTTKVVLYEYDKDMLTKTATPFLMDVLWSAFAIPGHNTAVYTRAKITGRGEVHPRLRQVVVVWSSLSS
jgi:hypothetical protein